MIKRGQVHHLFNTGNIPLTVLETQFGAVCEEDDIVRMGVK